MPMPTPDEYQHIGPRKLGHDTDLRDDTTQLLTTREVAKRLGLSKATVLRRWRNGEIAGYRLATNVLRFDRRDIEGYLSGCRRDCNASAKAHVHMVTRDENGGAHNAC